MPSPGPNSSVPQMGAAVGFFGSQPMLERRKSLSPVLSVVGA